MKINWKAVTWIGEYFLRSLARITILVILACAVIWLLYPALVGFHIGHNAWTDTQCLSRIVQWCK